MWVRETYPATFKLHLLPCDLGVQDATGIRVNTTSDFSGEQNRNPLQLARVEIQMVQYHLQVTHHNLFTVLRADR